MEENKNSVWYVVLIIGALIVLTAFSVALVMAIAGGSFFKTFLIALIGSVFITFILAGLFLVWIKRS